MFFSTVLRLLLVSFIITIAAFHSLNGFANTPLAYQEHLHLEPQPVWVEDAEYIAAEHIPVDEISYGVYYQMLDNQIKVEKDGFRTYYSRFVETVVNQTGVEDSSQINIDFDPSYQKLALNSLYIVRDGKRINRLGDAQIAVFSRETDLDKQIYNGNLTMNILLDDVQVGDTIDYSYTRYGSNPVYQSLFSYVRTLSWSVPVYRQKLRLLWGKPSHLHVATKNITVDVAKSERDGLVEYQIDLQNQPHVEAPSELPKWFSPYGRIHFNETETWQEVADWARPMYEFGETHADIAIIAAQIQLNHASKAERIAAALKYTQENIRYVGLEMGQNSHVPTAPQETLALKYGDCKDKTSLFIALLKAMDIPAYPALVDTDDTKLLAELAPGINLFNHVIVWLEHDGKNYWLDPTLSNQKGNLASLYQPDYGYALILKQGTKQLTAMQKEESGNYSKIVERFLIPEKADKPVTFSVDTTYSGYDALKELWRIEREGKNSIAEQYEDYYQRIYPGLNTADPLVINENDVFGLVEIKESYVIESFWEMGDENWEADFYPQEIRDAIYSPKQVKRDGPLAFGYPNNIEKVTRLEFVEDGWEFGAETFTEDNPFFFYKSDVQFENRILTLSYVYNAKVDHIPEDKIEEYLSARKRVREDAYYGIIKYVDEPEDTTESQQSSAPETQENVAEIKAELEEEVLDWLYIIAAIYVGGILFILVSWQIEARRRPDFDDAVFYPINIAKFVYLSIITFGIYNAYWMYRNWKAVQLKSGEHISPFWRGFFVLFWIYPLFNELKNDSIETYQSNRVIAAWMAALIAIVYVIVSITGNVSENYYLGVLFLLLPFLLIPFASYINYRNQHTDDAFRFNSKWRIRHYVATLLFAPLVLFFSVFQLPVFPSDAVVTHSELWQRDVRFFYRQKLVPADEKVDYFYSNALFDIKEDGNGFTQTQVFSYWQDGDAGLQKEIASYEEIKAIDVQYSDKDFEDTIVTITRHDETDFMLFVSNVNEKDKLFVDELNKRWKSVKSED